MSILTTLKNDITAFVTLFDSDVLPYIENTLEMFATQEGKAILTAAIAAAPMIATGGFAAAAVSVAAAAISSAPTLAAQDITTTLLQAQTALQLVKVSTGTASPSDASSVAALAATETPTV